MSRLAESALESVRQSRHGLNDHEDYLIYDLIYRYAPIVLPNLTYYIPTMLLL